MPHLAARACEPLAWRADTQVDWCGRDPAVAVAGMPTELFVITCTERRRGQRDLWSGEATPSTAIHTNGG
jgi:hypothetical protein